ncbi:MAG: hypothetical protein HOV97_31105 [Nonomuraea sp.]|nr:hypothetical protein [Nonomuraea sp.]
MVRALLCLLLAVTACASCTPGKTAVPTPSPSPVRRTVADSPPYLCNFIPRGALVELTGYRGSYKVSPNSGDPVGNTCVVSNDERSILLTSYDTSTGRRTLKTFVANGEKGSPVKLPEELGKGQTQNFEARLFKFRHAGVWFRCGATSPFVSIAVMKNPARDQDHDLVQLVKIAERRFGEMFGCEPSSDPR